MPSIDVSHNDTLLVCSACGNRFKEDPRVWRCTCGAPLDLAFVPKLPGDFAARMSSREWTWLRYREALPIEASRAIRLGEGCTPLVELELDGSRVFVKQDHLTATGSFKDRGAFVLISHAMEIGVTVAVEDSSGNAGAAVAAYCARAGIGCSIYVPSATGVAKTAQIERSGADVVRVPGSREACAEAARGAARAAWYASHVWNPFFFHGTKLFAYELWEQLGYSVPSSVILPVGNGTLLLGAYLGFSELKNAGLISALPMLIGVQAERCSPVADAFGTGIGGSGSAGGRTETIASGIAVGEPARKLQMLGAVRASGGTFVAVTETEINSAVRDIQRLGFSVEPTGAVGYAAIRKLERSGFEIGERPATAFTGHGLKKVG